MIAAAAAFSAGVSVTGPRALGVGGRRPGRGRAAAGRWTSHGGSPCQRPRITRGDGRLPPWPCVCSALDGAQPRAGGGGRSRRALPHGLASTGGRRAPGPRGRGRRLRPRRARRSPARQYAPFLARRAAEAPPWWDDAGFARPRSAGGRRHLVRGRASTRPGSPRDSAARGACPTEAEWERAARGGLEQAPTAWGDACRPARCPTARCARPGRRGAGTPNGFGLCDMGTIVHEWCADWYAPETAARRRREPRVRRGAPAAADRGGTTCAGRRPPRAAACPRRSATPTTASACCGSARDGAPPRRADRHDAARRTRCPSWARASSTSARSG